MVVQMKRTAHVAPRTLFDECGEDTPAFHALDGGVFEQNQKLAVAFSRAIAAWSDAEVMLGNVLSQLLGAHSEPALAILHTLRNSGAQEKAISEAAACLLDVDDHWLFCCAMRVGMKPVELRNRLAHGVVGVADGLSDALIIARQQDMQLLMMHAFRNTRGLTGISKAEIKSRTREFSKRALVYRAPDLERDRAKFEQSMSIFLNLSVLCARLHHGKKRALDELHAVPEIKACVEKRAREIAKGERKTQSKRRD